MPFLFRYDGSYITDPEHREAGWRFDEYVDDRRAAALLKCDVLDLTYYVNKMFTVVNPITAIYNYDGNFRVYRRESQVR